MSVDPIRTERLLLEPGGPAVAREIHEAAIASQRELARWMAWAAAPTLADTEAFYAGVAQRLEAGISFHFVIRPAAGGPPLGSVDVRRDPGREGLGDMGYWIRTDATGRGLMTEAAAAAREFGFRRLGLSRLELRAGVANVASCRVAEKIGFRWEGSARGAAIGAAGPYDCHIYGMLASDPRVDTAAPRHDAAGPDFSRGLVTAVVVDDADGTVLMVAHMNAEAYGRTKSSGHAWFWSRSRDELWEKGATSGNYLDVVSTTLDCDRDAVLVRARPHGPACHTGARSCFEAPPT